LLTGAADAQQESPLIGQTVGNYKIQSLLGEGGMGTVYLAEHTFMGWRAAVKVLRRSLADDRVLVKRFINEAHAVKAVRHPNIIDIIDVGVLPDGLPYLLMELLEGESLAARLHGRGRLPLDQVVDIACQTASALGAAHDKGIVHRDLKPDNLFLVRDPEHPLQEKVKVLDFGIAKLRDTARGSAPAGVSANTRSGVLLGTPAYMSPEQCRGIAAEVDHRTDIYALSVIVHQMLAGKAPFVGAGTGDVLIMHVSAPPPPVRQENPAVPPAIEQAILRGLAKQREQRYQTMAELAAALDAARSLPSPVSGAPFASVPTPPPRMTAPMTAETPFSWPQANTRVSTAFPRWARGVGLALLVALPLLFLSTRLVRRPAFAPQAPGAAAPGPTPTSPSRAAPSATATARGPFTPEDPPPPPAPTAAVEDDPRAPVTTRTEDGPRAPADRTSPRPATARPIADRARRPPRALPNTPAIRPAPPADRARVPAPAATPPATRSPAAAEKPPAPPAQPEPHKRRARPWL
jgi:serine/threonine protein kinase